MDKNLRYIRLFCLFLSHVYSSQWYRLLPGGVLGNPWSQDSSRSNARTRLDFCNLALTERVVRNGTSLERLRYFKRIAAEAMLSRLPNILTDEAFARCFDHLSKKRKPCDLNDLPAPENNELSY